MTADTHEAELPPTDWLPFVLWNAAVPVAFGLVIVVSVPPINLLALVLWVYLMTVAVRDVGSRSHALGWTAGVLQVVLVFVIMVAGHFAPMKHTEQFLDRAITLPKSQMTLSELAGDPNGPRPEWRPSWVHISSSDDEKASVITFPATTLTLRQFVQAIEMQSTLCHRFASCGNGFTILRGEDCGSGLVLSPTRK